MPIHLEAGTGNEPGFAGLLAALEWAKANPLNKASAMAIFEELRRGLADVGANVVWVEGETMPVVSFTVPKMEAADVGFALGSGLDVVCRTGLHCAPKLFRHLGVPETVRLSLSRFTTRAEVDEVLDGIRAVIEG
jgi:selenocysteine lyase/cysteine desulfurase